MFNLLKCSLYLSHLIQLGIITRSTGNGNRQLTARMRKVSVATFTAPIYKTGLFQLLDQFAYFWRHKMMIST